MGELILPKITIVTPSLNQVQYLEATIQSILSQNYPNLEYIIVDGGSTDGSVDIIKKYEQHLAWWVSEKDNGLYDAILKGFSQSKGEIMAWLNADDLYHSNAFSNIVRVFQKFPEIEWLSGVVTTFDEAGFVVDVKMPHLWSKLNYLNLDYRFIQQESIFWKRSLWDKAGGNLNIKLKYAGDLELWFRFFNFAKLYYAPILIGGFRQRSQNQITLDFFPDYVAEASRCIKEELEKYSILKKIKIKLSYTLDNFCYKTPLIRRLYKSLNVREKHLGYPKTIKFDRFIQEFVLTT